MGHLYEKYVWEVPVRVTHWVNVLAIVTLALTGLFIGSPQALALTASAYVMGWVRFIHFVAGYAFAVSVLSRIYWAFVGNRYASIREFFPFFSKKGRTNMLETFRYYTFTSQKGPHTVGHNALAGTAYSAVFILYLVMICSGFALYTDRAPQSFMHHLFGWTHSLFSDQGMRLTHHMVMWLLIAFAIHHIYSAWLMDIKERGGVISSIFGGYKAVKERE